VNLMVSARKEKKTLIKLKSKKRLVWGVVLMLLSLIGVILVDQLVQPTEDKPWEAVPFLLVTFIGAYLVQSAFRLRTEP
jgi:hypothetical protein